MNDMYPISIKKHDGVQFGYYTHSGVEIMAHVPTVRLNTDERTGMITDGTAKRLVLAGIPLESVLSRCENP